VHKELHLSHSSYSALGPLSRHIIKVFAYTANYVTLHRELELLDETGFELAHVYEIPMRHYHQTVDMWDRNMFENRERLKALAGDEFYKDYRTYLKAVRFVHTRTNLMQLHVVASRKMG
jgi:cyclopropane fatty-acyl-phospholipid synthase-like methyltransferase